MKTLLDLNSRVHSWLDDRELLKFCFMLAVVSVMSCGISLGKYTPWPLATTFSALGFTVAVTISRWVYISWGRRIR